MFRVNTPSGRDFYCWSRVLRADRLRECVVLFTTSGEPVKPKKDTVSSFCWSSRQKTIPAEIPL